MKLATRIFGKERGNGAQNYYITSGFGERIHPITKKKTYHNGVDYGTHGNKWPQYALEDGIVDNVFVDQYGAKDVWISYPRLGIKCLHGHLDKIYVKKGQKVNHTTKVGDTGETGLATAIHLHLGVKYIGGSEWIDPESIDYEEDKPTPTPTGNYPFNGKVAAGSIFYTAKGTSYKNRAKESFEVVVQGELNDRYKIYASRLNPHVVYVDKNNIDKIKISKYPFTATIKMGSTFYNANGKKYKVRAKENFKVQVQGELNGKYKIYATRLNPHIVYCNKTDIVK